jgi:hypothetical protein
MGLVPPILVPEMTIEYMKHLALGSRFFRHPKSSPEPPFMPMPRLRIQALEEPNGSLSDQIW